jgi:putative toxin-antitoxin system antitoxin component (TIGR02293 family)
MAKTKAAVIVSDAGPTKPAPRVRGAGHLYVTLLGLQTFDTAGLRQRIGQGLAYRSWVQFLQNTGLTKEEAHLLVSIAPRTLVRRKEEGRLHPDESDRLVRAARVFARAVDLFGGNVPSAREWLARPQRALGGATPLDYAATELGAREVENVIGRLEHGIPT